MAASEIASYTYDAAGRMTGIRQQLRVSQSSTTQQTPIAFTAGYDSRNRITSFAQPGQSVAFSYDANGNRTSRLQAAGSQASVLETSQVDLGSNRLLAVQTSVGGTPTGTVTYTLDANGAVTADAERGYVYDASGRLAKVQASHLGETASIEYLTNAMGQRVFKADARVEQPAAGLHKRWDRKFANWLQQTLGWKVDKKARSLLGLAFVYDEEGNLIGTYSNGSSSAAAQQMEVIWLPLEDGTSIPVGVVKGGQVYAVHTDHLGTSRYITDAGNKPVWQWPYSAFGENAPVGVYASRRNANGDGVELVATTPALEFALRFPGQYCDNESPLCYNGWRYYMRSTGRLGQMDPAGLSAGANRAIYANNNSLRYTDRDGLNPLGATLAGAEIGSAIGPVGTVIGGLVGAGVGAWLGWNAFGSMLSERKTPNSGDPDSCHVNPGSGQERKYGADGKPEYDIDWDHDHGQGIPHGHNWDQGSSGEPVRGPGLPLSPWPRGRFGG